jgi:hypothetical protein
MKASDGVKRERILVRSAKVKPAALSAFPDENNAERDYFKGN